MATPTPAATHRRRRRRVVARGPAASGGSSWSLLDTAHRPSLLADASCLRPAMAQRSRSARSRRAERRPDVNPHGSSSTARGRPRTDGVRSAGIRAEPMARPSPAGRRVRHLLQAVGHVGQDRALEGADPSAIRCPGVDAQRGLVSSDRSGLDPSRRRAMGRHRQLGDDCAGERLRAVVEAGDAAADPTASRCAGRSWSACRALRAWRRRPPPVVSGRRSRRRPGACARRHGSRPPCTDRSRGRYRHVRIGVQRATVAADSPAA